jgi:RNA polymerase sigma factor (sigma-70 family)
MVRKIDGSQILFLAKHCCINMQQPATSQCQQGAAPAPRAAARQVAACCQAISRAGQEWMQQVHHFLLISASAQPLTILPVPPDFLAPECLRRLKQDDEQAFDALPRHYSALAYQLAYSYLKSRPVAEEILQECFIKIWEKWEQRRDNILWKGYLFITAYQAALYKLRCDEHHLPAWAESASVANEAGGQEMEALYLVALERLLPKQREVFVLSQQQDLSYLEMAEHQDVSAKAVEVHIV